MPAALDEGEHGKASLLGPAILSVGDGPLTDKGAVLDPDDEKIDLTCVERFQAAPQGLGRRRRLELVEDRRAVRQ